MKIRFLRTLSTDRQVFRRAREYDVPDSEANELIEKRIAAPSSPVKSSTRKAPSRDAVR